MKISSFFELVEIRTKLASVIPFILGTLYSLYRYRSFRTENFLIMFIALISFDMATTAINNYCDYKKVDKSRGFNYEGANAMVRDNLKESTVIGIIFILLLVAATFGIMLTIKTNIVVLVIGIISFIAGILYTFGPIPISRMPLGEIFSGFFMGFVIIFLSIYIHVYDQNIVGMALEGNMLSVNANIKELLSIFLISVPCIAGISNIMLANNICDVDEDIVNKRFTLPFYIGRENALKLFRVLYYIGYMDIVLVVVFRFAPAIVLLALITIIPVNKNIAMFFKKVSKRETFGLSVKNFALMNTAQILLIGFMDILSRGFGILR